MATPILRISSFEVSVERQPAFLRAPDGVLLPGPGVYTLEGPNQSGKTIICKLATGMLPSLVESVNPPNIEVDGRPVRIRSIADAHTVGIVAIYQDDELIPSMRVIEQLVLRHGKSKISDLPKFAVGLMLDYSLHPIRMLADRLPRVPEAVKSMLRRIELGKVDWNAKHEILNKATSFLRLFGDKFVEDLDKYPPSLSGGGRALSKLVSAYLVPNIRILFLDEICAGVASDVWPRIVQVLREWAYHKSVAIVAISHNPDEINLWQPEKRFRIRNEELKEVIEAPKGRYHVGVPERYREFPVIDLIEPDDYTEGPLNALRRYLRGPKRIVVLTTSQLKTHLSTKQLLNFLSLHAEVEVLTLDITEEHDATEEFKSTAEQIILHTDDSNGAIFIVGGGFILNFGGFIASAVYRGLLPTVVVPTTLLAVADVAVGSKTAINIGLGSELGQPAPVNVKHTIGTYLNPAAVLLDYRYLEGLPEQEFRHGLVECLKHGLLQDEHLYSSCPPVATSKSSTCGRVKFPHP